MAIELPSGEEGCLRAMLDPSEVSQCCTTQCNSPLMSNVSMINPTDDPTAQRRKAFVVGGQLRPWDVPHADICNQGVFIRADFAHEFTAVG